MRKTTVYTFTVGVAIALLGAKAMAVETYPSMPIKWVVPNPAGGGTDVVVRTIANALAPILGKPFIIENKPGAATMIGADTVARSQPDGYTVLSGDNATFATNQHLYKKISYDPTKDFAYVGLIARFPLLLVVRSDFPANSVAELTEYARKNPGQINFASPGTGLPHHLALELLMEQTGVKMTHVAYKGSPAALQDMMGGQIDAMFLDVASGIGYVKDKRVKTLGIASMQRFESLPDVPTLNEIGIKDFEVYAWQGMVVPDGTPDTVVSTLNEALRKVLTSPEIKTKLLEIGVEPIASTPDEFAKYAQIERDRWGKLIRAKGLKIN